MTIVRLIFRHFFIITLLLTGCGVSQSTDPRLRVYPTVTPLPTPVNNLPTFSDWRVGYIGPVQFVHAVALDGSRDVIGPLLPTMVHSSKRPSGMNVFSAGIASDGHTVALSGISTLAVSVGFDEQHNRKCYLVNTDADTITVAKSMSKCHLRHKHECLLKNPFS